jgi:hypothetical protein
VTLSMTDFFVHFDTEHKRPEPPEEEEEQVF